jgi:hypothetical protein
MACSQSANAGTSTITLGGEMISQDADPSKHVNNKTYDFHITSTPILSVIPKEKLCLEQVEGPDETAGASNQSVLDHGDSGVCQESSVNSVTSLSPHEGSVDTKNAVCDHSDSGVCQASSVNSVTSLCQHEGSVDIKNAVCEGESVQKSKTISACVDSYCGNRLKEDFIHNIYSDRRNQNIHTIIKCVNDSCPDWSIRRNTYYCILDDMVAVVESLFDSLYRNDIVVPLNGRHVQCLTQMNPDVPSTINHIPPDSIRFSEINDVVKKKLPGHIRDLRKTFPQSQ